MEPRNSFTNRINEAADISSGWVHYCCDFWLDRLQMPTSHSRRDPDETSGQKLKVCGKCGWLALVTYHLFSSRKRNDCCRNQQAGDPPHLLVIVRLSKPRSGSSHQVWLWEWHEFGKWFCNHFADMYPVLRKAGVWKVDLTF